MKKFWMVVSCGNRKRETLERKEDALELAQQRQAKYPGKQFVVMESMSVTVSPVAEVRIEELR